MERCDLFSSWFVSAGHHNYQAAFTHFRSRRRLFSLDLPTFQCEQDVTGYGPFTARVVGHLASGQS